MAIGNVNIQTVGGASTLGMIPASGFGFSFLNPLYRYANLTLPYSPNDPGLTFTYNNSTLSPVVLLYARFFNLLNESSAPLIVNVGTSAFSTGSLTGGGPGLSGAQGCLDVRGFGAVGDGVTDDTVAVQAAIDQAYQNFLGNQLVAGQVAGQAQLAQSIQGGIANGSGSALALALPLIPSLSGTLVLCFTAFNYGSGPGSPATPVVTDNRGNVYTQAAVETNGELLLYTYYATVKTAALTTVTITMSQRQFNSYIAGIFMEFTGVLAPITVDATNSVIVPAGNFQAPSLSPTGQPDLVIYSIELSLANGVAPVPPGDFTLIGSQPTLQPNGLNGAVPIMAVAARNWNGAGGINFGGSTTGESWVAVGYDGVATMVAFRLVPTALTPQGKTIVCIPNGVNCLVSPKTFDHFPNDVVWGNSQSIGMSPRYGPMAYSLVMRDGVTLEIDGALTANPNVNSKSISGNTDFFGDYGWALITNSAWLLNKTISLTLQKNGLGRPTVSWASYLAGQAFNEGPRNRGIKITGSGKVYLNGQNQAGLTGSVTGPGQLAVLALARFFCVDQSTIEDIEIVSPFGMAIEWGHSTQVKLTNTYVHDAPNVPSTFGNQDDGIFELDMLRNSDITNNIIVTCPASRGILDFAGYQNTISGNTLNGCFTGYEYRDSGGEWIWSFGPPLVAGVFRTNLNGITYGNVTHNSQITLNKAINNNAAARGVIGPESQSGNPLTVSIGIGSYGFCFNAGWGPFQTVASGAEEWIPVTGTGFHDNIASGNTDDAFEPMLMAFQSLANNTFGPSVPPVTNGQTSVTGEIPTGVVDGTNKIFTTAHLPVAGSLVAILNGLQETAGTDFSVSGNQITFTVAPNPGSTVSVNYQYASGT
jgi:hypothetical protein